jgi:ABC-type nitrate/sulfonate/bicarbonate transport system permease component
MAGVSALRRPSRGELIVLNVVGSAAFFLAWHLLAISGWFPQRFLPGPLDVIRTIGELAAAPYSGATLQGHLGASLVRFFLAFGLAAAVGIPLGLLMGWYRWLDDVVSPLFEGLRFVAPIAWVPFAGLWFGSGIGGPVLVIFSGAFPPCLINAYRGARGVDKRLVEASLTLGASGGRVITDVLLPAALPSIVAGLRVSAGIGWQSLVGAELIVVAGGIGYMMVQGQLNIATHIVMAGMVAIGIVGVVIDVALRMVERRLRRNWTQDAA